MNIKDRAPQPAPGATARLPQAMRRARTGIALLVAAGLLATAALPAHAAGPAAKRGGVEARATNRIVFQVSEEDTKKWNALFANIHNIQAELGQGKVAIAVVAIGPGLGLLKADSLVANRVEEARAAGVRFVACENTMKVQNVSKDDMLDRIDYARAGYVEIMRLQQRGWVYLRP